MSVRVSVETFRAVLINTRVSVGKSFSLMHAVLTFNFYSITKLEREEMPYVKEREDPLIGHVKTLEVHDGAQLDSYVGENE